MKRYQIVLGLILGAILAVVLLGPVAPAAQAQSGSPDPAPGTPGVFTERVCTGQDALVYQGTNESGAGVTTSTKDNWQCLENATVLVIGPWGGSTNPANAHSACQANGRAEVDAMADRTGWVNGSVWKLDEGNVALGHPLVVQCESVNGLATAGLNPHQSYITPEHLAWAFQRAEQLLTSEQRTSYCVTYAEQALSRNVLCATWFQEFVTKIALFSSP